MKNCKKSLLVAGLVSTLFISMANTTFANSKNDEKINSDLENKITDIKDHWAKKPIIEAMKKKLMLGTSDTLFSPNEKITRGEFITILGRLGKVDTKKYLEVKDKNIESGKFYTEYMNWAVENKLLPKTSKALGDENITREEMAHILASYLKVMGDDTSTLKLFVYDDEKEISDWAYEDIQFLANKEILSGTSHNKFSPKKNLTRAEVAQIISKLSK